MGKVIVDRVLSQKEYGVELNDIATKILYDMVYHHHERLDGSGYPEKLKGDEVSPYMRIMAMADSYEAMTGHRPYRKSLTHQKAIQRLQACVDNGKLDAHCLEALKKITSKER
jgi:putative two-component system response regulator